MKVTVRLSEGDIRQGLGSVCGGSCPMYYAIAKALGEWRIHVTSTRVEFTGTLRGEPAYPLPETARIWISSWDGNRESGGPMEFELETA